MPRQSSGSSGYRVDAGELQAVATQYKGKGDDIRALRDTVLTPATEPHFGRRFGKDIAPAYLKAFEGFQNNLTEFGRQTQSIGDGLNDAAAGYTSTEDANRNRMRTVDR